MYSSSAFVRTQLSNLTAAAHSESYVHTHTCMLLLLLLADNQPTGFVSMFVNGSLQVVVAYLDEEPLQVGGE